MAMSTDERLGRIMERLDQQDRNTALQVLETKDIAVRLARENKEIADQLAAALVQHTKDDTEHFAAINVKLDALLEYQHTQKGSVRAVLWIASAIGAALAALATVVFGR